MEERIKDTEMGQIDLLEVANVIWQKIWAVIMCFVIGAVLFGGYTKMMVTPQYTATSMIYILGRTTSISSVAELQLSSALTADFTIMAKSRAVINGVIKEMDLNMTYDQLKNSVNITNPSDSHILQIEVTNPDPKLAKDISNTMANAVAENIASVMATDKPSIAEKAVTPGAPSSPNLMKNIAMGGIVGAALAVGLIVLGYMMDDTIKTEEDVRKYLQINTLASVSLEKKRRKKSS
ncbi:Capsular polysaccharide type 8 biosynthesis protein cap8A [Dorea longicatena]|uniref:Capsular polysaccharide type 8 biosynthesis protein cap8A n=1 Tax=Dorea longicatena TaxID=88431 RepID=A0A564UWU1_9FIRM|nr:Wzz/FepE/Etk N-terminal domain-containing protein [Dorea longicatena]VUX23591.1 Capsular polysaccharide type 8 biosynthesis protein cap8A [Dorea longicatena]